MAKLTDSKRAYYEKEYGKDFVTGAIRSGVPEHIAVSLSRYILSGEDMGDFMTELMSGDLFSAYRHADSVYRLAIGDIVEFVWRFAPSGCYGSYKNVSEWMSNNGLLSGHFDYQ